MARIDDLRALAKKRQRAVSNKISRIRTQVGAEVKGSTFDPRKSNDDISKMRSRDLERHIAKLNSFMNRKTQFVPGTANVALPRAKWQNVVRVQTPVNQLHNQLSAAFNNIPLPGNKPGSPNTIGLRKAMTMPTMQGDANQPFNVSSLDSRTVPSLEALDRLEKRALKQSSPGYAHRAVKGYRQRVDKALEAMSAEGTREEFNKLSDFQFYAMWGTPGIGVFERIFSKYEEMQKRTVETIDSDDFGDDFRDVLEWARRLPIPKGAPL